MLKKTAMTNEIHKSVIQHASFGYAWHEIIFDNEGVPNDFRFIEVNMAFEKLTGLSAKEITGKTIKQVFMQNDFKGNDWIWSVIEGVMRGETIDFEHHARIAGNWLKVVVHSPVKNYFSAIITDVSHEYLIAEASKKLSQFTFGNIDYLLIASLMKEISGAAYVVLNKFDSEGKSFSTLAIDGNNKNLEKGASMLGIQLLGNTWPYDPVREEKIKGGKITTFRNLRAIGGHRFPKDILKIIETMFGTGKAVIVKTTMDNVIIGDFTLIFNKDKQLKNRLMVESFADLTGLTLCRVDAEKLHNESENKYRIIFENAQDVFYETALDGTILEVSPSVYTISKGQYNREDLIGKSIYMFYPYAEEREKLIKVLKEKGSITDFEITLKNRDGELISCALSSKLYLNKSDNTTKIIGALRDVSDRRKAEETLRESEEKYRNLVETASDSIFLIDSVGKIIDVNNSACKTLGYLKNEIIGQTVEFVDPNFSTKEFLKFWESSINEQRIFESTHRRKDGSLIPVELSSEKYTQNGKIFYYGIARDLTERKLAEKQVENAAKKFRGLIENAPDGVVIIDAEGRFVYASPNAIRQFGYEGENFIGRSGNEFTHPDDLPFVLETIGKIVENPSTKKTITYRFMKKSGIYCWIETTFVNMLSNDAINGFVLNFTDVTKRKKMIAELVAAKDRAEESEKEMHQKNIELSERNQFIQTILDNLPIGLALNDTGTGNRIYSNRKFEEIYGWPANEMDSVQSFFEKVYPDENFRNQLIRRIMADIASGDKEKLHWENIEITCKNGAKKIVNAVNIPLVEQNTMVSTVTDITELYLIQKDLLAAKEKAEESDRLKSAFLANMSHEIRTPMNGILGFTGLLNEPGLNTEQKQKYINIIEKSGQRMLNTVNDLIDISKIETGQMPVIKSSVNLKEQLQNLFSFFIPEANEKGLKLILKDEIKPEIALVETDLSKLDSILTNLIKNAIKYTDSGSIEICGMIKNDHFEFCVKDTGIGIPPNRQAAVFNRFEQADIADTRAFQGSGLGLAITKAYVEMLNGKIWLESEVDVGTTFYVSIPVEQNNDLIVVNERSGKIKRDEIKKLKIIVAEDDEAGFYYLEAILRAIDCEIIHCYDGQAVVDYCKNNPDTDLILMDIRMPVMNGYEAAAEIRKFNGEVVIIAQTAFALAGDKEKALAAGCNDYLSKPIKKADLISTINLNLERGSR